MSAWKSCQYSSVISSVISHVAVITVLIEPFESLFVIKTLGNQ